MYYRTEKVRELTGLSCTTIKKLSTKAAEYIPTFAEKDSIGRLYNMREIAFIKFVSDFTKHFTQEGAFHRALEVFYNLDCNRNDSRI